jgi:hypothetical protein
MGKLNGEFEKLMLLQQHVGGQMDRTQQSILKD